MNIIFFGTPQFVVPILEKLIKHFDVVGVVTTPDALSGRNKIPTPTPVKQFAIDKNIKQIFTFQQYNNETIKQLRTLHPDLFIVVAYGHLIPKEVLAIPQFGSLNIHPSLLPKYRGTTPVQTAILNGDQTTGVSVIQMDEKLDHGPILIQWEYPIQPDDTNLTLHEKTFHDAAEKLPGIINGFVEGKLTPKPQDDTQAVFTKKITKQNGYFDVTKPLSPEELDRRIRAYYPWPTAWTKIKIKNQEVRIKFLPKNIVQLEGGKAMEIKEFLNGYPEMKGTIEKLFNNTAIEQ